MRLYLYMPEVTEHDEIQKNIRSEETKLFYFIECQLLSYVAYDLMSFCISPSVLTPSLTSTSKLPLNLNYKLNRKKFGQVAEKL